jgi:hypothetical protein
VQLRQRQAGREAGEGIEHGELSARGQHAIGHGLDARSHAVAVEQAPQHQPALRIVGRHFDGSQFARRAAGVVDEDFEVQVLALRPLLDAHAGGADGKGGRRRGGGEGKGKDEKGHGRSAKGACHEGYGSPPRGCTQPLFTRGPASWGA